LEQLCRFAPDVEGVCDEIKELFRPDKIIENYDEYAKHLHDAFNYSNRSSKLPGAFAFNGGSKIIRDDINSKKNVLGQTEMTCSVYKGTMSYFHKGALTSDFVDAVSGFLPDEYNEDMYSAFVTNFGTHVAVGLEIGGRWGWQTMLDYTEYGKMKAAGLNVDAALNASGYERAGLFFNYSSNVTTRFINSISKNLTYNTGGEYSKQDPDAWASTVKDKPDPLILTLLPIHLFLSSFFIPGVDNLDVKKKNLKNFMDSYCAYLVKKEGGQQSYCGSQTIVV